MENEFAKYKQALRLQKLGFDEPCFGFYIAGQLMVTTDSVYNSTDIPVLKAPTFSQAFRWFREKYQIFPEVLTDCTTEPKFVYTYNTFYGNPKDLTEQEWGWENNIGQYSDIYRTYEEAELACLDKLLEIVETKSTQNTNDGRTMEKLIESNRKFDEKNNDNVKYDSSDRNEDMPNITNFFI